MRGFCGSDSEAVLLSVVLEGLEVRVDDGLYFEGGGEGCGML